MKRSDQDYRIPGDNSQQCGHSVGAQRPEGYNYLTTSFDPSYERASQVRTVTYDPDGKLALGTSGEDRRVSGRSDEISPQDCLPAPMI